jgi:hypothetical protein
MHAKQRPRIPELLENIDGMIPIREPLVGKAETRPDSIFPINASASFSLDPPAEIEHASVPGYSRNPPAILLLSLTS